MSVDPLSIGRLMNSQLSNNQRQEIAAEEFEGYLVEMLVREMRKTIPEGMFSSPAMETFTGLLDQTLAKELAQSGRLGLADSMLKDLMSNRGSEMVDQMQEARLHGLEQHTSFPSIRKIKSHLDHIAHEHEHAAQPVAGRLTSKYGMRLHPISKDWTMHDAIDIAAPKGTAIKNVLEGKVVFAGDRGGYGQTIVVEHADGRSSLFAHCSELSVKVGDVVQVGDKLGEVGNTGNSTGNHLHFELRENGKTIDPLSVFDWHFEE